MPQQLPLRNTLDKLDIRSVGRFMLLSCLVGLVAGIGAVAFYMVTNFSEFWILNQWAGFHPPMGEGAAAADSRFIDSLSVSHRWFLFLVPALGGLFSG